jgi:hypothetical protein
MTYTPITCSASTRATSGATYAPKSPPSVP